MYHDPYAMPFPGHSVERGGPATEPVNPIGRRELRPSHIANSDARRDGDNRAAPVAPGGAAKLSCSDRFLGRAMNNRSEDGDDGAEQRRSAALIGLIIILALAIGGV